MWAINAIQLRIELKGTAFDEPPKDHYLWGMHLYKRRAMTISHSGVVLLEVCGIYRATPCIRNRIEKKESALSGACVITSSIDQNFRADLCCRMKIARRWQRITVAALLFLEI